MKKESIKNLLIKNLGYDLTKSQEVTADLLAGFFIDKSPAHIFLLKGYAGTGKTTLIAACVRSLLSIGIKVVLLEIGRAHV